LKGFKIYIFILSYVIFGVIFIGGRIGIALATQMNVEGYVTYGVEEKIDVFPGLAENKNYLGVLLNFNKMIEAHILITPGAQISGNHYSLNYHLRFFSELQPFFNIGVGSAQNRSEPLHLNLDVGFQYETGRYRVRVFHKSQNHFWGDDQYGQGAFLVSVGYRL